MFLYEPAAKFGYQNDAILTLGRLNVQLSWWPWLFKGCQEIGATFEMFYSASRIYGGFICELGVEPLGRVRVYINRKESTNV